MIPHKPPPSFCLMLACRKGGGRIMGFYGIYHINIIDYITINTYGTYMSFSSLGYTTTGIDNYFQSGMGLHNNSMQSV